MISPSLSKTLVILVLLTFTIMQPAIADDSSDSLDAYKYLYPAIVNFCRADGFYVPSRYAQTGYGYDEKGAYINIQGFCTPPQFVSQGNCSAILMNMCAQANIDGGAYQWDDCDNLHKITGRSGCQKWHIHYTGEGN